MHGGSPARIHFTTVLALQKTAGCMAVLTVEFAQMHISCKIRTHKNLIYEIKAMNTAEKIYQGVNNTDFIAS